MELEFSRRTFGEKTLYIKFNQNPSRVVPCGRTEGQTDMKIIVAFRSFANAPKNRAVNGVWRNNHCCSESHTMQIIVRCGQNTEFFNVTTSGTYSNHRALKC